MILSKAVASSFFVVLFGDSEVAEKILKADAPPKMKALGRKVKGFNDDIWKENRCDIVYEGNLLKVRP